MLPNFLELLYYSGNDSYNIFTHGFGMVQRIQTYLNPCITEGTLTIGFYIHEFPEYIGQRMRRENEKDQASVRSRTQA